MVPARAGWHSSTTPPATPANAATGSRPAAIGGLAEHPADPAHEGVDRRTGLPVALKGLHRGSDDQEHDLPASVDHPNVIAVRGRVEVEGTLWVALDLADGGVSGYRAARPELTVTDVAEIGRRVAGGRSGPSGMSSTLVNALDQLLAPP